MTNILRQQPGRLRASSLYQSIPSSQVHVLASNGFFERDTTITAGVVKYWTGAAWVSGKPVKVWGGAAWNTKPLKVWSGTSFKTAT